jgi:hypothetical protein
VGGQHAVLATSNPECLGDVGEGSQRGTRRSLLQLPNIAFVIAEEFRELDLGTSSFWPESRNLGAQGGVHKKVSLAGTAQMLLVEKRRLRGCIVGFAKVG